MRGWQDGLGQAEDGSSGNREPAKKRQKECSRHERAGKERPLLGFNILDEEVREV